MRHFSNELENRDLKNKEEKRENNGAFQLVGSLEASDQSEGSLLACGRAGARKRKERLKTKILT